MPKIILSYRRSDSDAIAGRIRDKLVSHYGDESVFMDIDSIPFGLDFREHVKTALSENDILIAVIGPKWVGPDADGRARINEETDPVRIEVETALKRDIPVVPVLVGGASMPSPSLLPTGLQDLPFRNAAQIDAGRDFHQHMERLIRSMDRILKLKRDPAANLPSATADIVRQNAEHLSSPVLDGNRSGVASELISILVKYGIRFADPEVERQFLIDYRQRFYPLGQSVIGVAVAAWLVFGSTALAASQGSDLASIKFFYVAAPILLILFFASFLRIARRMWQSYYVLSALVFIAMIYVSARILQGQSWFRPEYVTMTFMAGIVLVGVAPALLINAILLQLAMVGFALYYILKDLHMEEFPALYATFSFVFLGVTLLAGACLSVTHERSLRLEFAAVQALRRLKRD